MSTNLVIGASGQVGEHLVKRLVLNGESVTGTYFPAPALSLVPLDIRDKQAVATLFRQCEPDTVYLPAAITNVDYCELNPDETYLTNVQGTCNVVQEANRIGAKLVFFSSDYVFDGRDGPYSEIEPANPLSQYGRQKLIGEHYIGLHARDYLIIRTTVVYGWESQEKNFVQRLVTTLKAGQRVRVPVDQIGSPTYTPNLADAVIELVTMDATGLFNVVGPKLASRYEFAVAAAQAFDLDPALIDSVFTSELKQAAPRPLKAGMRIDKVQKILRTRLTDYEEGVRMMVSEQPKVASLES